MALTAKKVYAILKRQISDMEAKIKTPIIYRGTVATADLLPLNPDIGDMYNIESKSVYGEAGMNVAWNGVVWDTMGAPIDMALYIKSSELADWVKQQNKPTYTAEEVGALPADTKIPSKTSDLQNDSGFLTKIPDNYLSGTDKTLSVSGQAADAKTVGDKNVELLADILSKLDKNQGSENSGKIAGINESGDIVPMFPVSVDYNKETNCLEFGSDQKMELNKGINLDDTLTKTGYAADAGTVGEITNSLKEDISNKITKFYASNQGETHLADSDDGKIMDMMIYGKSEQKQYSGKNLIDCTLNTSTVYNAAYTKLDVGGRYSVIGTPSDQSGVNFYTGTLEPGTYTLSCTMESGSLHGNINIVITDVIANCMFNNGHVSFTLQEASKINLWNDYGATYNTNLNATFAIQIEKGSTATSYEPYTGGIPSPNPDYPQEIKRVVNPTVKITNEDGTQFKTVTLPYTLNAIPVNSGGNVTIGGQQYIADYVDVERGKLVRMVEKKVLNGTENWNLNERSENRNGVFQFYADANIAGALCDKAIYESLTSHYGTFDTWYNQIRFYAHTDEMTVEEWRNFLSSNNHVIYIVRNTPEEIDLTSEEIVAFKTLATYYPTTNISVNSEQLDGYTVFNYPISMANGWNYVKKQLNDNRDYIYDMDIQSAEAYVNSEYAVALTELEV